LVDVFAASVCLVIAFQAWRYLQIEIEYGDEVLVDTPAWIAHSIMPAAFGLMAYQFLIGALRQVGDLVFGKAGEAEA
jgi:TRAP-type C4-dicarboxylate transport system permease small subunit